ncbi:hypothetical protein RJ641_032083 [Dillenia turbinata]|uniref:Uncharacterized protein n=1 Tax=Dillenia turbinata TaxID=194707 RepID=A0AAN8VQX5_9MAGN
MSGLGKSRPLERVGPTETLEIDNGLSLTPRVKLLLTIYATDAASSVKPINEWQLKRSLLNFLTDSLSIPIPQDDGDFDLLFLRRHKDLKKRKRDDPVALGSLFIRHLGFLNDEHQNDNVEALEKSFLDWRKTLVQKMNGIEVNLEGYKFKLSVSLSPSDDFYSMKKDWEAHFAFGHRGYSKGGRQQVDTIVLRGVPSRWFAEPRVSSKPSLLVTHTIFSTFGKIKNLDVAEDDDQGKEKDEDSVDLVSGLQCKIMVQFEKYNDFYNAMKVLCGGSLQKQGSRMRADYEVTWDKDGFFRNSASIRMQEMGAGHYRSEAPRRQSEVARFSSSESARIRRFKNLANPTKSDAVADLKFICCLSTEHIAADVLNPIETVGSPFNCKSVNFWIYSSESAASGNDKHL